MERTLSVAELAKAIAGADQAEIELIKRRVRHWTLSGLLPVVGNVHEGTGRHRSYPIQSAYIAAILSTLAEWGMPIGALKIVATSILTHTVHTQLWQHAVAGTAEVFLIAYPSNSPDRPPRPVEFGSPFLIPRENLETMLTLNNCLAHISLNLTVLFRTITL